MSCLRLKRREDGIAYRRGISIGLGNSPMTVAVDSICSDSKRAGRPKKLDEEQRQLVTRLYKEGTPIPEILKTVKISKGTLYSYVREETVETVLTGN